MQTGVVKLGVCLKLFIYAPLLGVFVFWLIIAAPAKATAGINQEMNFQGRLLNNQGATVADGYYNIEFKIYQDGDGQSVGNATGSPAGSLLWTEDHLNSASAGVQVKNGFLSVQLGSITPFGTSVDWNQDTLWLSMNIGDTTSCSPFSACSPDGEMVPMKRLSASPYALNAGQLGGLSSADFVQLAQGVQTDTSSTTSIAINKTSSGNFINLQSSGTDVFTITNTGNLTLGANVDHTLSVTTAGAGIDGKSLTIVAGASGTGGGLDGGDLILQGGAGSTTSGSVIVRANTGGSAAAFKVETAASDSLFNVDSIAKEVSLGEGLTLSVPNFNTPTITDTGGSIADNTTYYYGITATTSTGQTEISPIITVLVDTTTNTNQVSLSWSESVGATGYKIYRNTSNNFTTGSLLLTTISGSSNTTYSDTGSSTSAGLPPTAYEPVLFKVDAAAIDPFGSGQTASLGSMYYNTTSGEFQCYKDSGDGGSWADCGVTTLQGAYNNATDSSTVPAVKLDSTHSTLNIQDADTTIAADLLDIRASSGSGLGAVMFGIGNTGAVTMQNLSDQNSAMRVINSGGTYLVNTNTSSGYFITNTTKSTSNLIQNPSFEAGGNLTSGEEGWNGPAQASIVNSSSNAHGGNYELQVTPNGTTLKTYAGTYYEVMEGDVIYFEAWVKNSSGASGTGGVRIEGYDKDKTLVTSATDYANSTTYALRKVSYTVTSTVRYVKVAATVDSGASSGTYYLDDLYLSSSQRGQVLFQNTADSTTAFRIQSSGAAQTLFTVDTSNNLIKVGDNSSGTDTETMFVVDSSTADPTVLTNKNGGLFYRSDQGILKVVLGGVAYQVCTEGGSCPGYAASAGSTVALQASSPGTAQTGNFNITGTGILTQLQTQDTASASLNSSGLTIRTGNATGSTSNSGNLLLDVGTATGTVGSITIGHASVSTTMPGSLDIQGSSALKLGTSGGGGATASILFRTSAGSSTVTLQGPGSNPTSSWTMVLPQNPGSAGECLKDSSGTGTLAFGGCDPGSAVNLQNAYDNSSSPATLTLADNKDLKFVAQDTTTDPSVFIDLQCVTSCGSTGRFIVRNGTTPVLTVKPNSGGIILATDTQIGSSTTDSVQVNFHLDSYDQPSDSGACDATTNQGALYYNSSMGSLRGCLNGGWVDVSNPDTLGLLTFGIIPSSGSNPYDLPSLVTAGASGPCKVSWSAAKIVHVEACTAYSSGRRINVTAVDLHTDTGTYPDINLSTSNIWGNICLIPGPSNTYQPAFTETVGRNSASNTNNMPTFNVSQPVLCLATIKGSTSSEDVIDDIYDVRTFTSTIKEAVNLTTAADLGMLVDAASGGLVPAVCGGTTCSGKLYGAVIASNGTTSTTTPNAIVASVGPAFVKAIAGTAGAFIQTSTGTGSINGYAMTTASIPNNAFYFSPGNTRTSWSTGCTSAATCQGSLYVNFIVR